MIRRFSEAHNEDAGQHYTPREVIELMVNLLFVNDRDILTGNIVKTIYDPACGTGGMLSVADDYLKKLNKSARLLPFGQEINDETFAICKADANELYEKRRKSLGNKRNDISEHHINEITNLRKVLMKIEIDSLTYHEKLKARTKEEMDNIETLSELCKNCIENPSRDNYEKCYFCFVMLLLKNTKQ